MPTPPRNPNVTWQNFAVRQRREPFGEFGDSARSECQTDRSIPGGVGMVSNHSGTSSVNWESNMRMLCKNAMSLLSGHRRLGLYNSCQAGSLGGSHFCQSLFTYLFCVCYIRSQATSTPSPFSFTHFFSSYCPTLWPGHCCPTPPRSSPQRIFLASEHPVL